jgi:blue copper oxidase
MKYLFVLSLLGWSHILCAQNAILIPDTLSGVQIQLELKNGTHEFYSGISTNTMGANGNILAPTLILNKGDKIDFEVTNSLNDTTTIHWHGLHVSPSNDGGPHTFIKPGETWKPSFKIMDKASTYWYHPHLHHKTDQHVSKGIAGLIIVRDEEEAKLALPRSYGKDDFPLVLQTKDFDANNQILFHTNSDDVAMVNATINGTLDAPAQVIRLRILNGASQRAFNVGFSGDKAFYQIASDGGILEKPVELTRLLLAPGERAEILLNLTSMQGDSVKLMSFASELPNGIYGATIPGMMSQFSLNGYNPNPLNGTNFSLLKIKVAAQSSDAVISIPASLVTVNRLQASSANVTRNLTLNASSMGMNQLNGDFTIGNTPFNLSTINHTVILNDIEIWSIQNMSGISHPFHIHDVQFNILDRNGVAPSKSEMGRKDVILIKPQETIRFIAKFADFADSTTPYMYHCHLLTHEDGGMMGQFIVKDTSSLSNISDVKIDDVILYPNPSNGHFTVNFGKQVDLKNVKVFDAIGQLVFYQEALGLVSVAPIAFEASSGFYILILSIGENQINKKIIVE